ncbi:MAG: hypothetical protein OEM02_11395, partial [Desulfobulbaceae bacterium]|nr:hypothetical protein [Desulfobulbaceae bacterium]
MTRRVVITGMGPVTAIGIGKDQFFQNLYVHKTNIHPIPKNYFQYYPFKSKYYVPLPEFSFAEYNIPTGYEKAMQAEDRMTVLATMLALEDAGFSVESDGKKLRVDEL